MVGFETGVLQHPKLADCQAFLHPEQAVPAAGVEPAASAFSARRSYRLSYTGISQRRRQESNLLDSRVAADRLAVRPQRHQGTRAGGGTRTHLVRVTRAVPGLSSIAGIQEQPVLVSSQLDRGSKPPSPPEGLARRRSRASGGTRTRTRPFTGGVLDPFELRWQQKGGRRESNPHNPGSRPGLAAALSSATVLQPGLEPGTRPSQGRVTSLSPSKQTQYPGQESNLDLLLRREP